MDESNSNDPPKPPPPAAVAASSSSSASPSDDATIAQCWQAVESLTAIFGFPYEVANNAVNEIGPDVTACYNFILDQQLAKDGGGAIAPMDSCPHLAQHVKVTPEDVLNYFQNSTLEMLEIPCCMPPNLPTGGLKSEDSQETHCPLGENWYCLATQKILCSRYVNGHALKHYQDTGNCIAVSLADLSVWCHACEAYIKDKGGTSGDDGDDSSAPILKPILQALETIKFGGDNDKDSPNNS